MVNRVVFEWRRLLVATPCGVYITVCVAIGSTPPTWTTRCDEPTDVRASSSTRWHTFSNISSFFTPVCRPVKFFVLFGGRYSKDPPLRELVLSSDPFSNEPKN